MARNHRCLASRPVNINGMFATIAELFRIRYAPDGEAGRVASCHQRKRFTNDVGIAK